MTLLPWHVFFGAYIYALTVVTATTGLLEKATFLQTNKTISRYSNEAFLINFLGIFLVLLGGLVILLIITPQSPATDLQRKLWLRITHFILDGPWWFLPGIILAHHYRELGLCEFRNLNYLHFFFSSVVSNLVVWFYLSWDYVVSFSEKTIELWPFIKVMFDLWILMVQKLMECSQNHVWYKSQNFKF